MDLAHPLLPVWLLALAWAFLAVALLAALRGGGRRALATAMEHHLFPACMVALLVLWQLRAESAQGPALHVLGATLALLMFGWRAALVGLCAVLAGHTAAGAGTWPAFAVNALIMVLVPLGVSALVLRLVARRLPGNPFGYILLAGFAGAGAAMGAAVAVASALLIGFSILDGDHLLDQFTGASVLLVFPEAFLTGATVAWLAMFYPGCLRTWRPPWQGAVKPPGG